MGTRYSSLEKIRLKKKDIKTVKAKNVLGSFSSLILASELIRLASELISGDENRSIISSSDKGLTVQAPSKATKIIIIYFLISFY